MLNWNASQRSHYGAMGRFSGTCAVQRKINFNSRVRNLVHALRTLPASERLPRIGIFFYMRNFGLWREYKPCIQTILQAAEGGTVDLILTVTREHEHLQYYLPKLREAAPASLRFDLISFAQNLGAENGVFLQQLLLTQELAWDHDIIFKVHTKEEPRWRQMMITDLCGSVEGVKEIIRQFVRDHRLGIVGPRNFTWRMEGRTSHVALNQASFGFNLKAQQQMQRLWSLMGRALPTREDWTSVAGSIYWIRGGGLRTWQEDVLPTAPSILEACDSDLGCGGPQGFDILVPTLVAKTHRVKAGL